jgi:hypothetical protein
MAEAPGLKYVALIDIPAPGDTSAVAYRAGDLVHEAAVEGEGAWLVLGVDVEPRPGAQLEMPARSASQGAWAAYAASTGMDADEAAGMTRAALIKAVGSGA